MKGRTRAGAAGETITIVVRSWRLPGRTFAAYGDVEVGVQVGKETRDPRPGDADSVEWRVEAKVARDAAGHPVLRGPAIHGKGDERFLYLVWQARGPKGPEMFRRAKLQLDAVPPAMIEAALRATGEIIAELELTDAKGGPRCASVRPPAIRWSLPPR